MYEERNLKIHEEHVQNVDLSLFFLEVLIYLLLVKD